jgi:hypothetical protein
MFCRLTLVWLLISLATTPIAAQPAATNRAVDGVSARGAAVSVEWRELPLSDAIRRLKSVETVELLLDRRVDPNQRISLEVAHAQADEIIARIAEVCSLGHARIGQLFYLGPRQTAERLTALARARRREVNKLPADARQSLSERRRIAWPQLTEPRGLVTRLVEDHGWRITRGERIPHDLWAAGALPSMALADQLTILLAGFDLTYRIVPDQQTIEIVPVDWASIAAVPAAVPPKERPRRTAPGDQQVFTLRVENQPVGKVLEQLAQRLGWQLTVDDAAIRAAGRSLDVHVSFTVEKANEDELLEAILKPARLKAERDGRSVRIGP